MFVLFGIVSLVFILSRVIGNPAQLMLSPDATPEQIAVLSEALGLTDPLLEQYWEFLQGLARGDLGESIWMKTPVLDLIIRHFPVTFALAGVSTALALIFGIVLGSLSALRPNSIFDRVVTVLSYGSVSMPEFWVALVLIAFVSVQLGLLPTSGFGAWQHYVLPVATLLARSVGRLAQITKSSLLDELSKQYAVVALAKGLSKKQVLIRHALRNSILGVITLAADELASVVAGAVVVETIFAWPGVGLLSIQAIENRDPYLLTGIVLVVAVFVLIMNFIVDIVYAVLNPRIEKR